MDSNTLLDNLDVGVVAIAPDWTIEEWTAARCDRVAGVG